MGCSSSKPTEPKRLSKADSTSPPRQTKNPKVVDSPKRPPSPCDPAVIEGAVEAASAALLKERATIEERATTESIDTLVSTAFGPLRNAISHSLTQADAAAKKPRRPPGTRVAAAPAPAPAGGPSIDAGEIAIDHIDRDAARREMIAAEAARAASLVAAREQQAGDAKQTSPRQSLPLSAQQKTYDLATASEEIRHCSRADLQAAILRGVLSQAISVHELRDL